jgi:hypothetical protein
MARLKESERVKHMWTLVGVTRHGLRGWMATCRCGWESAWHESKLVAEHDAIEHTYAQARKVSDAAL